jgi:predicted transcriptional regulator
VSPGRHGKPRFLPRPASSPCHPRCCSGRTRSGSCGRKSSWPPSPVCRRDPELIEGDIFRIVVKVPEFGAIGEVTPGVSSKHPASTAQVGEFCREPRSSKEIMAMLKLKHWKTFQSNYLNPLLDAGFIERTIPDKPSSRNQKYRLTEKGRKVLKRNEGAIE